MVGWWIKEKEKEISILKEEIKSKDDMIADYQGKMKKLENIMGYVKKTEEMKKRKPKIWCHCHNVKKLMEMGDFTKYSIVSKVINTAFCYINGDSTCI